MKKKKILHIISKFNGDYPLFDDFILNLDPSRFQSIVCFIRGRSDGKSCIEERGIETIYFEKKGNKKRGVNLKKLFELKRIVQEKGIDLIHCQRHKPTVYGVLTSLLVGGKPVVSTVHGTRRTRSLKRRLTNRFFLRKVDRIIPVSEAVKNDILETNKWLPEEKVVTVRNGLDYSKILAASSIRKSELRQRIIEGHGNAYWFGTAGRLTPKKNHERLIRAFAQVIKKKPDPILLIAGSGPLEEDLKNIVRELGLEKSVYLLGYRRDIPELLHSLDFFVFPSLPGEGLPLAILEAMAAGLPVIISGIEASAEILGEIECGCKVDPEKENDIRDGMLEMMGVDPKALIAMGAKARKRAMDSFHVDGMTKEIVEIYDGLL